MKKLLLRMNSLSSKHVGQSHVNGGIKVQQKLAMTLLRQSETSEPNFRLFPVEAKCVRLLKGSTGFL